MGPSPPPHPHRTPTRTLTRTLTLTLTLTSPYSGSAQHWAEAHLQTRASTRIPRRRARRKARSAHTTRRRRVADRLPWACSLTRRPAHACGGRQGGRRSVPSTSTASIVPPYPTPPPPSLPTPHPHPTPTPHPHSPLTLRSAPSTSTAHTGGDVLALRSGCPSCAALAQPPPRRLGARPWAAVRTASIDGAGGTDGGGGGRVVAGWRAAAAAGHGNVCATRGALMTRLIGEASALIATMLITLQRFVSLSSLPSDQPLIGLNGSATVTIAHWTYP